MWRQYDINMCWHMAYQFFTYCYDGLILCNCLMNCNL